MKILEEKIEEERSKLNYAIEKNEDYDVIYELSIGVDKLLEEYIKMRKN
ncbi:MAG: Spo0E family sporulation regulatory protein-aspartic acid phosphatase [Lachnospiraceae bacterium]|nr:Spo0E family sporulation regulatory protein-aspartic acid phosphatase [Lachnospiraceae bacterium]